MAEVLVQFDEPQRASDGRLFVAQVCGQRMSNGLWEAWIQFSPTDGGDPVRTPRETEQLTRGDLRYWAAGLTRAYLESALACALSERRNTRVRRPAAVVTSTTESPTVDAEHMVLDTTTLTRPSPVLDPFALYAKGEYILRQELLALDAPHLSDIIAAYNIPDLDATDLARTYEDALAERIVAGVQHSVDGKPTNEPGSGVRTVSQ
jgi:hypothetical protein